MHIQLSKSTIEWQSKIRNFVEKELIPWEVEAELNNGVIPSEISANMQACAIKLGLSRMDAPKAYGGLALSMVDQVAVWEQLGRVTNALCWCFPEAQHWMFEACEGNQYQIEHYLQSLMDGTLRECYAITEAESGSYEVINTTASACKDGYRINGEKWYVTTANLADFSFCRLRQKRVKTLFSLSIKTLMVSV